MEDTLFTYTIRGNEFVTPSSLLASKKTDTIVKMYANGDWFECIFN